jgi:hypothetical protein
MPLYNPTGSDDLTRTTTGVPTDARGHKAGDDTYGKEATNWLERIELIIKRYPWPTLIFAVGIGYALSRRMR